MESNELDNEFVPYLESSMLKEIGFDKPCIGYFNGNQIYRMSDRGTLHINNITTYRNTFLSYDKGKSVISNESDFKADIAKNPKKYTRHLWGVTVSAPLYQQAFDFLLYILNKDVLFDSNKYSISYNGDYYSLFLGGCNMNVSKSKLGCLKKLIEIVKSK